MRILIIDDKESARKLLSRFVQQFGHEPIAVADAMAALELLHKEPISLVVSDWVMPSMSGLELCRAIRRDAMGHYVYVILCSAKNRPAELVEGMEAGADDFITKPVHRRELQVRIRAGERILLLERRLHEQNAQLETLYEQLSRENVKLGRQQKQLSRQARTDFLTEVAHRRDSDARLQFEFSSARDFGSDLSGLVLDIEHFKEVNDTYGHKTGDLVLKRCAEVLRGAVRQGDFVGRYGGDEFVCIFPGTSHGDARTVADRMHGQIGGLRVRAHQGKEVRITVSVGLAQLESGTRTPAELLAHADRGLYSAKKRGRNLVLVVGGAA